MMMMMMTMMMIMMMIIHKNSSNYSYVTAVVDVASLNNLLIKSTANLSLYV
jgi:hypothetical protein